VGKHEAPADVRQRVLGFLRPRELLR